MSSEQIPVAFDANHPGQPLLETLMADVNKAAQPHNIVLDVLFILYRQALRGSPCCQGSAQEALAALQLELIQARRERQERAEAEAASAITRAQQGTHPAP